MIAAHKTQPYLIYVAQSAPMTMRLSIPLLFTVLCAIIFAISRSMAQDAPMPYRFKVFGTLGTAKYDASKDHKFNLGGGFGLRPFSTNAVFRGLEFRI